MPPDSKKTCFVIGPMGPGKTQRLEWLAKKVLEPILGDTYSAFTPDVKELGLVMDHVIRSCDRADLVVADTTGNNPNVLYEIAILDAMGRACIPVKFKTTEKETMAFDRAAYRYFELEEKVGAAQKVLEGVIQKVQEQRDKGELFSNPITNFFQNPLSSLASARGLARGYLLNLIKPCLQGKVTKGPNFARGKAKLLVQTLLPSRLSQATRSSVEKAFEKGRIKKIDVAAPGRTITAYVWAKHRDAKGNPIIVDIPTTMSSLKSNVEARLGGGTMKDPSSADFQFLERDEIRQFIRYLQIFVNEEVGHDEGGLFSDNYRMINVSDSLEPNLLD